MDKKLTFGQFLLSLLGKEKKHFKNLLKLLLERTWNIIIESLFEMVMIGICFGWLGWVGSWNDFHNILVENFLLSLNLNWENWWRKVVFYVVCVNFGMNGCVFEEKKENIRNPIIENFFKIV